MGAARSTAAWRRSSMRRSLPGSGRRWTSSSSGARFEVKLNGKTVVKDVVDGITGGALSPWEGEPGPLMLQGDHGKVRFRNIEVKAR